MNAPVPPVHVLVRVETRDWPSKGMSFTGKGSLVAGLGQHLLRSRPGTEPTEPERSCWFPIDQWWFRWGLIVRVAVLLGLAHFYDVAVFQDASNRLIRGDGVYAPFAQWFQQYHDGYYAYPPVYAYMLWVSGRFAALAGQHWWIHQLLIKAWMFLADLTAFAFLRRIAPAAARVYWTLWILPLVAIAHVQPDLWVGLAVALAYLLATKGRWAAVGLALAAGVGLKVTPLLIVPFLAIFLVRDRRWAALWRLSGALAFGLILAWLPYVIFFDDTAQFVHVVGYQLTRPAFGLTAPTGLRLLADAAWAFNALVGPYPMSPEALALTDQHLNAIYRVVTPLGFAVLGAIAILRRWTLAQIFAAPLLAFLLLNRVVNEQYLLQVVPLLLLTMPAGLARLVGPYTLYVLAALLTFFPQQYGMPLSPEQLLPESLRVSAILWIGIAVAGATGVAALVFSARLYIVMRDVLTWPAPDPPGDAPEACDARHACLKMSRVSQQRATPLPAFSIGPPFRRVILALTSFYRLDWWRNLGRSPASP